MTFDVFVKSGPITELPADTLISSSNTFHILGSGTAGQVKQAGGFITAGTREFDEYVRWSGEAQSPLRKVLRYINSREKSPSIVQKECLEVLIRRDSHEFSLGDATLTSSGRLATEPDRAARVIHAVGMTYDWSVQPNPPVIPANYYSVRNALVSSFEIAERVSAKSIAVPIMGTRKGGLSVEVSTRATIDALHVLGAKDSGVKKVFISLHNEELQKREKWFVDTFDTGVAW